jgi:hypothetical protein
MDLNIKFKTIKLTEHGREYLYYELWVSQNFLDLTLKAQLI